MSLLFFFPSSISKYSGSYHLLKLHFQKFYFSINFVLFFQEIALLSQFEHENIVRYLGTDKVLLVSWLN